jgi:hypothetical protein
LSDLLVEGPTVITREGHRRGSTRGADTRRADAAR